MPNEERVRTIEQTSKTWKAVQLLSMLAIMLGIVLAVIGGSDPTRATDEPSVLMGFGILMVLFGFLGFAVGRIGAWWYHG